MGFVATLIDTLVRDHGADPVRVYVTGMSNGAMLAHRMGYLLPQRIAAIAPVVGPAAVSPLHGMATRLHQQRPGAHSGHGQPAAKPIRSRLRLQMQCLLNTSARQVSACPGTL